jgi:transcriptional regulator with XRE-family HTH domain
MRRIREVATMRARGLNPPAIAELLGRPLDATDDAEFDPVNLGGRLRRARHHAGLTLKQAAARVDVSFSHLSGIERGVANPSLALLERLGQLYGTPTSTFWGQKGSPTEPLPQHWQDATTLATDRGRVRAYAIARGQVICGDLFEADPGGGSEGQYAHEGEELVHVLEGALTIWLEGSRRHVLASGQSLCFPSDIYHRWSNEGPGRLRMLWTSVTPASVAHHDEATGRLAERAAEDPVEGRVKAIV